MRTSRKPWPFCGERGSRWTRSRGSPVAGELAKAVHFVEAREHDRYGRGRWSAWELRPQHYFSARRAKRAQDVFLAERLAQGELWQVRVVTFERGRTYEAHK